MNELDNQVVMQMLTGIQTDLSAVKKDVAELKNERIRAEAKRLECEKFFDSKYVEKSTFTDRFKKEWESIRDNTLKLTNSRFDVVYKGLAIINTFLIFLLSYFQFIKS